MSLKYLQPQHIPAKESSPSLIIFNIILYYITRILYIYSHIVYVLLKLKAFQRERLVGPTLHSVLKLEQKCNKKICCENIV